MTGNTQGPWNVWILEPKRHIIRIHRRDVTFEARYTDGRAFALLQVGPSKIVLAEFETIAKAVGWLKLNFMISQECDPTWFQLPAWLVGERGVQ